MLTMQLLNEAQEALQGFVERTAIIPATGLCRDGSVYLKTENLQKTGSFKVRGAHFRISRLSDAEKACGVIACSAGNHAQGVALSASREGIRCIICMPEGAPISKIEKTRGYGAEVILCPGVYDDAYAHACALQKEYGYTFIHPFNDLDVIAGQGTIGLEILEQVSEADILFVPVGGGGLISGIAYAVKQLRPQCKVYGVEPAEAASMLHSLHSGQIETLDEISTVADGIAVKRPGERTFALCREYVDGIITVTENEIASAMLTLLEEYKMVAEGAGATSVAAAMYGRIDTRGKNVVCVVSGGNVDVNLLARIINQGLTKTGRIMEIETLIADKPRQLRNLVEVIAGEGANILSIVHDRDSAESIVQCKVCLKLETRGPLHIEQLRRALRDQGYYLLK